MNSKSTAEQKEGFSAIEHLQEILQENAIVHHRRANFGVNFGADHLFGLAFILVCCILRNAFLQSFCQFCGEEFGNRFAIPLLVPMISPYFIECQTAIWVRRHSETLGYWYGCSWLDLNIIPG